MDKVVIIGGGGHAKVVIDILLSEKKYEVVGFVAPSSEVKEICGIPYIGSGSDTDSLVEKGINHFIVAVGDNKLRKHLFDKYKKEGMQPVNAISPTATVSIYSEIGTGVVVMSGAVINAYAVIENNVIVNTLAGVDHDCVIESHSHIGPGTTLTGNIKVGEGVFFGAKSCATPNVKIGDWAIIGAGAVLISDINSDMTVVGIPAKSKNIKG